MDEALQAGIAAARAGETDHATALFERILSDDPDNMLALVWLGAITPHVQVAVALLERAVTLDPDNARARAGLSWAYRRQAEAAVEASTATNESISRTALTPISLPYTGEALSDNTLVPPSSVLQERGLGAESYIPERKSYILSAPSRAVAPADEGAAVELPNTEDARDELVVYADSDEWQPGTDRPSLVADTDGELEIRQWQPGSDRPSSVVGEEDGEWGLAGDFGDAPTPQPVSWRSRLKALPTRVNVGGASGRSTPFVEVQGERVVAVGWPLGLCVLAVGLALLTFVLPSVAAVLGIVALALAVGGVLLLGRVAF